MAYALIVDDSKTACVILARKLKQLGLRTDSVYSAQAAFDFLKETLPDVIFLDHNMPDVSGLEAIKVLKDNPSTTSTPILMYTSQHDEHFISQAKALGAVDVLPKELGTAHIEKALASLGLISQSLDSTTVQNVVEIDYGLHTDDSDVLEVNASDEDIAALVSDASRFDNPTGAASKKSSGDVQDIVAQLTPRLRHQLYLTTVEVQQAVDEQLDSAVKQMKKQLVNEVIPLSEMLDRHSEDMQRFRRSSVRWQAASFAAVLLLGAGLASTLVGGDSKPVDVDTVAETVSPSDKESETTRVTSVFSGGDSLDNRLPPSASETDNSSFAITSSARSDAAGSDNESAPVKLLDTNGIEVGDVVKWNYERNSFFLINEQSYLFELMSNGSVSSAIPERFFTSADCFGDSYVSAFPGQLFKDTRDDTLWYTPKGVAQEIVEPLSKLTAEQKCERVKEEEMTLSLLLPNDIGETGVDQSKFQLGEGFSR